MKSTRMLAFTQNFLLSSKVYSLSSITPSISGSSVHDPFGSSNGKARFIKTCSEAIVSISKAFFTDIACYLEMTIAESVSSALDAINIAKETAAAAGIGGLFIEVTGTKRVGNEWEVDLHWFARKFKARIDSQTGKVTEWKEVTDQLSRELTTK
jgi:hypothetical protein